MFIQPTEVKISLYFSLYSKMNMNLKTTLIVCILVVMITSKTESRGGMMAKLCNLFADEPTGEVDTPTVEDH